MANEIPGKTATQLRWRWNTICPDRSGMPWSSEEDDKLIAFQQTNGNNWVKCADVVSLKLAAFKPVYNVSKAVFLLASRAHKHRCRSEMETPSEIWRGQEQ